MPGGSGSRLSITCRKLPVAQAEADEPIAAGRI